MLKYLKSIFIKGSNEKVEYFDECIEDKNGKLVNEEIINESLFYSHDEPDPYIRNYKMPSQVLDADNVNTSQVEIIDQKTGQKRMVSSQEAAAMQEKIPDGINVPGIGKFGGKNNKTPQQPAARPQQPQTQPQTQPQAPQPQQHPNYQQPQYQQPTQPQYQQPQGQPQYQQQPYNVVPQQTQQIAVQQQPGAAYLPPSEIAMIEGAYHLYVDLPGVHKESLSVNFNAGNLIITGERVGSIDSLRKSLKKPRSKKEPILTEHNTVPPFVVGKFEFKYPFQRMVDESSIVAEMNDGILHITLPHRVKGEDVSIPIM